MNETMHRVLFVSVYILAWLPSAATVRVVLNESLSVNETASDIDIRSADSIAASKEVSKETSSVNDTMTDIDIGSTNSIAASKEIANDIAAIIDMMNTTTERRDTVQDAYGQGQSFILSKHVDPVLALTERLGIPHFGSCLKSGPATGIGCRAGCECGVLMDCYPKRFYGVDKGDLEDWKETPPSAAWGLHPLPTDMPEISVDLGICEPAIPVLVAMSMSVLFSAFICLLIARRWVDNTDDLEDAKFNKLQPRHS